MSTQKLASIQDFNFCYISQFKFVMISTNRLNYWASTSSTDGRESLKSLKCSKRMLPPLEEFFLVYTYPVCLNRYPLVCLNRYIPVGLFE